MNFKYALFDMDGTILDSLSFWPETWLKLGEKFLGIKGFRVPPEIDKNVRTRSFLECGPYLKEALGLAAPPEEIVDFIAASLLDFYKTKVTVKPGMRELIAYLHDGGVRMGLATATGRENARAAMECFGLWQYFDVFVSCEDEDVGIGKHSPKVYEKALRLLAAAPADTILFEDAEVAIRTAKTLGLRTVGIGDSHNYNVERVKADSAIFIAEGENACESFKKQLGNLK